MKNEKWIWLDMDGTFVDLYGVNNWLDYLLAHDNTPYEKAKPLVNILDLLITLAELKLRGWNIGVISWCSKDRNTDYEKEVIKAKKEWLYDWGFDSVLDKVLITSYGVRKADTCRKFGYGILVDDEEPNRNEWDLGKTINANENIISALAKLL